MGINELKNLRELVKRDIIKKGIKTPAKYNQKYKLAILEVGEEVLLECFCMTKDKKKFCPSGKVLIG